jgi:hypothetical protein
MASAHARVGETVMVRLPRAFRPLRRGRRPAQITDHVVAVTVTEIDT